MDDVILSIYVPTYNHEKYIARALDSILMQKTDYAYEVLVGEDASTDNTRAILKEYEKKYPGRFQMYYREKNMHKQKAVSYTHLDVYKRQLYREVLEEAKNLGIKLVFTTHDYFGICPKVTLFRNNQICDGDCGKCEKCNERALSIKKIKILQSPLYRGLKDTKVVKKLRKSHRRDFFDNGFSEGENCGNRQKNQYEEDVYKRQVLNLFHTPA